MNRKALKLKSTQTFGREARKHVAEKKVKLNTLKQDIIIQTFGREVRKLKPERNKKVMKLDFTPTLGKWARKHTTEDTRKVLKVDFSQILKRKQFGQFGDQDPSWSREQNDMGGSWVRENWP